MNLNLTESGYDDDLEVADEHGSCGVAAIVDLGGKRSKELLRAAIDAGASMQHRTGYFVDERGTVLSADGAGVLFDPPKQAFLDDMPERARRRVDISRLQVASLHFDRDLEARGLIEGTREAIKRFVGHQRLTFVGLRPVPVDESIIDTQRLRQFPHYEQLLYMTKGFDPLQDRLDIFTLARRMNNRLIGARIGSMASERLVYKGVLRGDELFDFFPDLKDMDASVAIVHDRFATNKDTADNRAQPFGTAAANGEINSISANRKALMDLARAWKFFQRILVNGGSDSAHLNDMIEFMLANGVSLPEAVFRLIPPSIAKTSHSAIKKLLIASQRAMRSFGMWEGPTALLAMDKHYFVAHLDRLGLRPLSWMFLKGKNGSNWRAYFSEMGAVKAPFKDVIETGRLGAGDLEAVKRGRDGEPARVLQGDELFEHILSQSGLNVSELANSKLLVPSNVMPPGGANLSKLKPPNVLKNEVLAKKLAAFGWSKPEIASAIARMKSGGPVGSSMGVHAPLAILDPETLSNLNDLYLARAAIITNPPFDPIGEHDVVDHTTYLGHSPLATPDKKSYQVFPEWVLDSPVVSVNALNEMRSKSDSDSSAPKLKTVSLAFDSQNYDDFNNRIHEILDEVVQLAQSNGNGDASVIVLSDCMNFADASFSLSIPPVLILGVLHAELVRRGLDRNVSLVVESGTVRSGHDIALMLAHGASAVCPYVLDAIAREAGSEADVEQALCNLYEAEKKELVKVMSKLGITSADGAYGGYWFSAVGIAPEVSSGGGMKIASHVRGLDMPMIFEYLVKSQLTRFNDPEQWFNLLAKKMDARERGIYDPQTQELLNLTAIPRLDKLRKIISEDEDPRLHSDEASSFDRYQLSEIAFAAAMRRRNKKMLNLRDCLEIEYKHAQITPEMLEQAPSIEQLFRLLTMSHMSLGAHGPVAHAAMVRGANLTSLTPEDLQAYFDGSRMPQPRYGYGMQSANGEGGEESERSRDGARPMDRSLERQIGTAAWGVDLAYLMEADEINIKIAQGAKPGEGGDLPGQKVNELIASIRHVKVGTRLISPPPNHDIYSIEDLKGRIRLLRAINPRAKVSLKVAAMPDLGQIIVGAVKAGANAVEISGYDAGTASAGEQSIRYTGLPVEPALAEVHQALVKSGLRHLVELRADGKMLTPQDVVKSILLGADSVGLGTLMMLYVQCIACISCHTNKCPTGITTQNQQFILDRFVKDAIAEQRSLNEEEILELQRRFGAEGVYTGLITLLKGVQVELAKMGVTADKLDDIKGAVQYLKQTDHTGNVFADSLDLSPLLRQVKAPYHHDDGEIQDALRVAVHEAYKSTVGERMIANAEVFLNGNIIAMELPYNDLSNEDRELGAHLAGQIYERLVRTGKFTDNHKITIKTSGNAGHAYGGAISNGMTMLHEGFLNDSVGQYMSGNAVVAVRPHSELPNKDNHALLGNQAGFAATGGAIYCAGTAGRLLGVRNSGATIVAEGATDYAFEYMTDGLGILLGDFRGEIASRMTGGKLFIHDPDRSRRQRIAKDYVNVAEMGESDLALLKDELQKFAQYTGKDKSFYQQFNNFEGDWAGDFAMIVPK